MSGTHLTIAAETWVPWFIIEGEPALGNATYSGVMWNLLLHLSNVMNFTYTIVRPPDGKWGVKEANGNWNGMLGMLQREEVDFALGPFSVTKLREEACDFTFPLMTDYWTILMPVIVKGNLWSIFQPFSMETWVAFLISLPFVFVAMCLAYKAAFGVTNAGKVFGFVFRSVLLEPGLWYPHSWGFEKVFSTMWLFMSFILTQAYSGTLISLLTAPSFPIPINSLEDLLGQTELPYAIESGSIIEGVGAVSEEGSLLRTLYDTSIKTGLCKPNTKKIKAGEFAEACLLLDSLSILSSDYSKTGSCNLYIAEEPYLSVSLAVAVQSNNTLLSDINREILVLLQSGLPNHWLYSTMPNMTRCSTIDAIKASNTKLPMILSPVELFGIFVCTSIGFGFAILAFSGEWIFKLLLRKDHSVNIPRDKETSARVFKYAKQLG